MNKILTRLLTLALLAMVSVGSAWAQDRMSGVLDDGYYKIINVQKNAEWYLVPAQNPENLAQGVFKDGKPILTTKKTNDKGNFTWRLKKMEDGRYQMINAYFWNYVHDDGTDNGTARCAHMESTATDDDAAFSFHIDFRNDKSAYTIYGGSVAKKSTATSFNNFGGVNNYFDNYNQTNGNNGVIGYWSWSGDAGSQWYIEKAPCPKPHVNYDPDANTISFSYPIADENVTFRYTTDGTNPSSASTAYNNSPLTINGPTIYKVTATRDGFQNSEVVSYTIEQVATPEFDLTAGNSVAITCATEAATIYYTTDGSTPTTESLLYEGPLTDGVQGKMLKAIAVKYGYITSEVAEMTEPFNFSCAAPVIKRSGNSAFTLSCSFPTEGVTIYYTINNDEIDLSANPTNGTRYEGGEVSLESLPATIHCIAVADGYRSSIVSVCTILQGSGTTDDPYLIEAASDFDQFISMVNDGTEGDAAAYYLVVADFSVSSAKKITAPFKGVFDGGYHTISGLSHALFNKVSGGTVKNVALKDVNIRSGTNVGVICNEADGATRIYNCGVLSGSVSGMGYVGSMVGRLDGEARVINCYSFANVSGGTSAAGIVGYNNVASTRATIKTMVMNCMYYGNVADAASISPIYGGQMIDNSGDNALNNFNYYSFADFSSTITTYNCALGAEERFLTRFEIYRQILNSNRELAAWYATGSVDNARTVMAKWVLDKAVAPYPILKSQDKYTSIINYDPEAAASLGTLTVTISGVGDNAPAGATITTTSLKLTRTDKDPTNYNFNYDKVQLPYYNDIGIKNYTGNRVVVGWKVTAITGGTAGTFKKEDSAEGYNFADRNCTQKDLYSVTGRVLSQGAYFNVPNGVTAITIEPYWANAVYLSDPNYDKTYDKGYTAYNVTNMGTRFVNKQAYSINGSSQMVYTNMGDAITALGRASGKTVYDYAVVLVGNYHHYYNNNSINNDTKGLTIMSADLDGDNEPDNCFFYQHQQRQKVTPIRFDFLCWTGIGMAQKPSTSPRMPNIGIFYPRGWFEVTNTVTAQFYEIEYDCDSKDAETGGSPLILLGGVVEQITSAKTGDPTHTKYIHIGDNAWFKMFNNGIHQDQNLFTPHIPISVTGGDYERFYLSGMFKPTATVNADNAECYISGGRFGEVAGAGQEQINGDVTWKIDHADIESFYGGGINDAKPVLGNITVDISHSNVSLYCGGPKFGNMASGKEVKTTATDCTFGRFFGAGYGGTAFNRDATKNVVNQPNYGFSGWATSDYKRQYDSGKSGIATNYEYELFAYAGFADDNNVGRFYVNYASLSLATAGNVTSALTGCTITENFYGGGNLGKVVGNVTSTLDSCTVLGSVYGAGFSAKAPTADVLPLAGFTVEPYYDGKSGTYTIGVLPEAVTYTWKQAPSVSAGNEFEDDGDDHYILTTVDMSTLGTVQGDVEITITGDSKIGTVENDANTGHVFGGGEESQVIGNTSVILAGNTQVLGSVYGGGKQGNVSENSSVLIKEE